MKVDSSCHCGNITYEAEVDPEQVFICHCTDCQNLSASAFRTVVRVAEKDFALLSGSPKTYVKTAESGAKRAQAFCPDCGSAIYATSVGDGPKTLGLRVGCIRQCAELRPQRQFWTRSALGWIGDIASLPGDDKQ